MVASVAGALVGVLAMRKALPISIRDQRNLTFSTYKFHLMTERSETDHGCWLRARNDDASYLNCVRDIYTIAVHENN
jgi:hypothetical protein